MIERIDTFKVTVTVKGEDEKIHLLKREEKLSVNYNLYNTAEQALESFLHFMEMVYKKGCIETICFEEKPFIYEVIDDKKSISAYRVVAPSKTFSHEAIFLLNSFGSDSLNDILRFLKDYAESECSKDFSAISLLPSIKSKARVIDTYDFLFGKDEIKNLSMEELKEKLLGTKLIGYLNL